MGVTTNYFLIKEVFIEGKLPYISNPGVLTKILQKIMEAQTPSRFTQDYLNTKLSCKGGNYNQFIPLAKKLGLLKSDGSPTEIYKRFRNVSTSKIAMAAALKHGYREMFERNEYANSLSDKDLRGLVLEITGLDTKDRVVDLTCQTFAKLKGFADFDAKDSTKEAPIDRVAEEKPMDAGELDLRLSYSINLVLPKTDDIAVFNAIFRSLKDNLLRK